MKYKFNGWQRAGDVKAINNNYDGIETPLDLYDALCEVWCIDTCAPRLRELWSDQNKTCGQCSITAFLAQDIFGGDVYAVEVGGAGLHCYNKVGDVLFDLASEQFGDKAASLIYDCSLKQDRESKQHFANQEKRERYELLKERLLLNTE